MKYKNIIHMDGQELEFDTLAPEDKKVIGEQLTRVFMASLGYEPVTNNRGDRILEEKAQAI